MDDRYADDRSLDVKNRSLFQNYLLYLCNHTYIARIMLSDPCPCYNTAQRRGA